MFHYFSLRFAYFLAFSFRRHLGFNFRFSFVFIEYITASQYVRSLGDEPEHMISLVPVSAQFGNLSSDSSHDFISFKQLGPPARSSIFYSKVNGNPFD